MAIKLVKGPKKLKFGLYGSRAYLFEDILKEENLDFEVLESLDKADEFDIILESGVYEIIPEKVLDKPKYGFFGIHETPLPEGKGWAPIQWTVKNKRPNLVITLYKLTFGVDMGDISCHYTIGINKLDTLEVLEDKRKKGIQEVFKVFISELLQGVIVTRSQSGVGSYQDKRNLESCELDSSKSLISLWDDIRICDNKLFPAYFIVNGEKIILRYEHEKNNSQSI